MEYELKFTLPAFFIQMPRRRRVSELLLLNSIYGVDVNAIKNFSLWLSAFALCCATLSADDDMDISLQDLSSEKMMGGNGEEETSFRISARGDWIGRSKINKHRYNRQSVEFYTAEIQAEGLFYCFDKECKEGLGVGLGYTHSHFKWNKNESLRDENMDQLSLTVLAFSQRLHNWIWMGSVTANWEPKYGDLAEYTNYDLLFWGKYNCLDDINFHIGFLALTGDEN